MKAFGVIWTSIKTIYDELFLYIWLSILWWAGPILSLMIGVGLDNLSGGESRLLVTAITALLLFATVAPLTAALYRVANRSANYKRIDGSFFWEVVRRPPTKGWLPLLIMLILIGGLALNIRFYFSFTNWVQALGVFFAWILLLVLMASQFFYTLFWQQDEDSLRLLLRNAFVLAIRFPLHSFLLLILQVALLILFGALAVPLFLFGPALVAVVSNTGMVTMLQEMGLAPPPPVDYR